MNEIRKQPEVWQLTNIKNKQLAKSKNFRITSLANRMTTAQNILFSFALLNAKVDGDFAEATFTIDELKNFVSLLDYERHRTSRILQDLKAVGESSILMIDEKMINDPLNGSAKGIMIFSSYSYQKGKYHFIFNSNKIEKDGVAPISGVLRSREENPLIYRLDMFASLNFSGQALYENILIANQSGLRKIQLSNEDLRGIFGTFGKSMERYDAIKRKHLAPAVESINSNTELNIIYEPLKSGRKIVGAELRWTVEKTKLASKAQIATATELYVELLGFGYSQDDILLKDLYNINEKTIGDAINIIKRATKEISEIRSAIEKTAQKKETTDKSNDSVVESKVIFEKESNEYGWFFNRFESVEKPTKSEILGYLNGFVESDRNNVLELAYEIFNQNGGEKATYIATVLRNWRQKGITTAEDARKSYEASYAVKRDEKKTRKRSTKTNVPKWSKPDYKNETTEEEQVDMKEQQNKLLAKIDNPSQEPTIVEGQTNIYDFLDE